MFSLTEAEHIVTRNFFLFWNGWDIIAIDPTVDGYSRTDGVFYNGKWSVARTIRPNSKGDYAIPVRYSRNSRTTRSRSK